MTKFIDHRAKSAGAVFANAFNWLRLVPDAFAHTIERFAIGKGD
jgi:hypothetical protein